MLTPEQCRAARGWLDWGQEELAQRANVSLSTVRDFERGKRKPYPNNLDALRRAFQAAGVQLLYEGEKPVGLKVEVAPADASP